MQHLLISRKTSGHIDSQIHTHTYYEILILLSGHGRDLHSQQWLPVGSVLFHTPSMPHGWEGIGEECACLSVRFSAEPTIVLPKQPDTWPVWPDLIGGVMCLLEEAKGEIPGWPERARSLLTTIITRPLYAFGMTDVSPADDMFSASDDQFVEMVNRFLREHLAHPITIDEVASAIQMSRRSLTRHFRRLTGESVTECLFSMRMDYAVELLMGSDLPIVDITRQAGFHTPSYFTYRFRERYHCAPAEWRKRFKRNIANT